MDDDEPRRQVPHEIGMPLDTLSIEDLQTRITLLEGEIARLRQAIADKGESRDAADAVFKF